jgi:acylphosphatase
VRRRVFVSGRVQGVWFRESCRRTAVHHEVSGWVRNTSDGRVEAVFEGARDDVDYLVDWCKEGPRHAQVASVDVREELPTGSEGFEVR